MIMKNVISLDQVLQNIKAKMPQENKRDMLYLKRALFKFTSVLCFED